MITKYCCITFDGDLFPVAYSLVQEGKEVLVCQIDNPNLLGTDTWISQKEDPEVRRRRLSLYDGMLDKLSLPKMYSKMIGIKDKDSCFVIFGHNSLYKISDRVRKMGFKNGLFPNEDDYIREQERQKSKDFVKKYYPGLKVAETKEFSNVDEVIKFVEESDKFWVVKSDGNHGETIVPDRDDLELAKQQIKSELTNSKLAYNQGKLILEQKIMNAIEFAPQMIWYNGKPVCSEVEIETRMFGSGDIGDQTGGNENVIIPTMLDDKINEIAFPQIMHDIAKKHIGMFIADAGILSDGKDLYFTEFAGCFSDDTEILTESGWKNHKEIIIGENSLSLNTLTNEMEWKPITHYFIKHHSGDMLKIKTIDALVTYEHRFWMSKNNKMKRFDAKKLPLDGDWKIPRTGIWKGNNIPEIIIPAIDVYTEARTSKKGTFMKLNEGDKNLKINCGRGLTEKNLSYGVTECNIKEFYRHTLPQIILKTEDLSWILGLWLAEGTFDGRKGKESDALTIAQSLDNPKRKTIEERLGKIGIRYNVGKNGSFKINNRNLARYFSDILGLKGTHADTKFIPKFFKELSSTYLHELLMGYMLGDGCYHRSQWVASTTSKRLADDLQEIIHKIGWVTDIKLNECEGTKFSIEGREYTRRNNSYIISTKHQKINTDTRSRNLEKTFYDGIVWDVSVADNESLFVRRNGKAFFSSNCRWGWGGIFSELSAAGSCDDYFQAIVEGEDPYRFDFGVGLAVYSIRSDSKFPMLNQEGLSIFIKDDSRSNFFIMQCKMKKDQLVNVGYREFDSEPLGYVVGRGDTLQDAVKEIYDTLKGISLKGICYRPVFDFLSQDYTSSVINRIKFLEKENLI